MSRQRSRKKIPATLRAAVFARDGAACVYCGARGRRVALTLDHVLPHSRGGPDDGSNLVTACEDCNGERGVMPIDIFAVYLSRYKGVRRVASRVLRALAKPLPVLDLE